METLSTRPNEPHLIPSATDPDAAILQGFEASPFGAVFQDPAGRVLRANAAAARILGLSMDQLLGRTSLDPRWQAVRGDGSPFPGEEHPSMVSLRTGEAVENVLMGVYNPAREAVRWLHVSACPLFQAGVPTPYQVMSTFLDITATRLSELELRRSQARFRTFFEATQDAVFIRREDGPFLEANGVALRRYGYTLEEIRRMRPEDLTPDRLKAKVAEPVEESLRTGMPVEWTHRTRSGIEIPVQLQFHANELDGIPCLVVRVRDLSEQKRHEAHAQETRVRLEAALASMTDAVCITDAEGRFIQYNEAFVQRYRIGEMPEGARNHAAFSRRMVVSYLDGEPLPPDQFPVARALRGEMATNVESRVRHPDTGVEWFNNSSFAPIRDGNGAVIGSVVSSRDVTQLRLAETSVRLLSTALAQCPSAVVITDPRGIIEWVNDAFTDITGFAFPEVAGKSVILLNAGANPPEQDRQKQDRLASGQVWRGETRYRKKDGELYWAQTSIAPVRDARGVISHHVAVREDITPRKDAERLQMALQGQLRGLLADLRLVQEEERLRISREIHDDLGQLLTALKMDLGWLERRLTGPDLPPALNPVLDRLVGTSELADAMIAAVQRIATELRPSPFDQLGLEGALRLEVRRFQERSGIPCGLPADEPIPALSPLAAGNVFHICREALTNVGRHAQATRVALGWRLADGLAEFSLVDDGIGLTAADQAGKPAIGLTGMRERATLCGGTLTLEANPPHGTRVTVRVPAAARSGAGGAGP